MSQSTPQQAICTALATLPTAPTAQPHTMHAQTRCLPAHTSRDPPSTPSTPSITLSMVIPDAMMGHVISRAGTGLCQIHNYSHVKIQVSPHVGLLASHTITIQGTSKEVGDAFVAIGQCLVKHHIHPPCQASAHCKQDNSLLGVEQHQKPGYI